MKIIFLGCTNYSKELLQLLHDHHNVEIKAIFTIPKEFSISYSEKPVINTNYADLSIQAFQWGVPHYEVDSVDGKRLKDYKSVIQKIKPDVILVLGWYYMIPKEIRDLAHLGAWGIHASLLPNYAGGAPLVWAIIHGEKKTGVTLFRFSDGVDNGDIIDQESFKIERSDTIKDVYEKAILSSKNILNNIFNEPHKINFVPQKKNEIKVFPQRNPEDGEIDLTWTSEKIFNFVRAQSSPYPGAFIKTNDGMKLIIEKIRIE